METFLIFLALIAIQMIAAYSKQKKEAAKRQQQPLPPASRSEEYEEYEETSPIPDPFREIREVLGFPPAEKQEEHEEQKNSGKQLVLEKPLESDIPFRPITDRTPRENKNKNIEPLKIHQAVEVYQAIDTKNPGQGILWSAILQEPRYKVKWKRR